MIFKFEIGERAERFLERRFGAVLERLDKIIGRLDRMNENERKLNETLASVAEAISAGFSQINDGVARAADRVIAKLQAAEFDSTDEVAALEAMKTAVAEQANSTVDRLNQITPEEVVIDPVEPAPPAEDTTGTGTGSDTGTGTDTDSGTGTGTDENTGTGGPS